MCLQLSASPFNFHSPHDATLKQHKTLCFPLVNLGVANIGLVNATVPKGDAHGKEEQERWCVREEAGEKTVWEHRAAVLAPPGLS